MNSTDQAEIILNTILNQRNALYLLHTETEVTRVDLEMLSYFIMKRFVNFRDLQSFYPHTNVQVIKRSLRKLNKLNYLETLRNSAGNRPAYFCITGSGKNILKRFCALIACNDSPYSLTQPNFQFNSSVSEFRLESMLTHPSAKKWL